eukprot:6054_1
MRLVADTLIDRLYIFLVAICTFNFLLVKYDEYSNSSSKQLNYYNYYHTQKTKFIHSSIALEYIDDDKRYGLIANTKIPFGTVLSVELPMITIPKKSYDLKDEMVNIEKMIYVIHGIVNKHRKKDPEFKHIWDNEFIENPQIFSKMMNTLSKYSKSKSFPDENAIHDWVKYNTYWYGGINSYNPLAIYSILGRINWGLPQNAAVIFGGAKDRFICILIATKSIESGEEIVLDYFLNLHKKQAFTYMSMQAREFRGPEFGFDSKWNEEMRKVTMDLTSDETSNKDKKRIIMERLYSNGIIGKESSNIFKIVDGCLFLSDEDCRKKADMKRDIVSGDIFKVISGNKLAGGWTGDEFIQLSKEWKKNIINI